MPRHFKARMLCFALAVVQWSAMLAAQTKQAPPAPVPAQIFAAKKIFIANAGGDEMAEDDPRFSGGPDRAYNQFYAAMKNWGQFEIVSSPAQADLLLEIRQEVQTVVLGGKAGASDIPLFRLKIRDPRTNALLWGFHIHGQFGLGQGASDKNFDQAVDQLVTHLEALIARSTPADAAKP